MFRASLVLCKDMYHANIPKEILINGCLVLHIQKYRTIYCINTNKMAAIIIII